MSITKRRFIALTWLFLGAAAVDAGEPEDASPKPLPGRMFVTGRVLDPNGKPVPGATVAVYARSLASGRGFWVTMSQLPIGDARTDGSGRFRIDAPRTSSAQYERPGAVALAPGHGAGWVEFDLDDDQPAADITLRPEQVIHGRLFDLQGRPVPDVTLSVALIRRSLPPAQAGGRSRYEGISYRWSRVNDFPAWPRPTITDAEGRFTLRGLGRGLGATLIVHHPKFALQRISIEPDATSESRSMSAALVTAQTITGRVTYADTGEGVPHAPLEVRSSEGRAAQLISDFETDDQGRFRINPPPADSTFAILAYPPPGQPYLIAQGVINWPKAALEQSLDLAFPRGALLRGTVTEAGSGQRIMGATVAFRYQGQGQNRANGTDGLETAADGTFQIGATPSPGSLFIMGPSDDYVFETIGSRMLQQGQPGGGRMYAHAHKVLNLKPGIDSQEVQIALRRAATVSGPVVSPDGQPVREAWLFSRILVDPRQRVWASWTGRYHGNAHNGRFEIHGLDPETEVPVYFLEPKAKLGGMVTLSGKSAASGPVKVRLEPCGTARMRIVDPDGKPVVGRLPARLIQMVVTPGPPSSRVDKSGLLFADADDLTVIDTVNYPAGLVSNADGRITLPVLIPGATYRFVDYTMAVRGQTGPTVRKEFTVKPGETLDLGDIRIEKP